MYHARRNTISRFEIDHGVFKRSKSVISSSRYALIFEDRTALVVSEVDNTCWAVLSMCRGCFGLYIISYKRSSIGCLLVIFIKRKSYTYPFKASFQEYRRSSSSIHRYVFVRKFSCFMMITWPIYIYVYIMYVTQSIYTLDLAYVS